MKNIKSGVGIGKTLFCCLTILCFFTFNNTSNAQIIVGPSYLNNVSSGLGETYSRSGAQLGASYFITQNLAVSFDFSFYGKTLIDSLFNPNGMWMGMSEVFSVQYYFFTSNFRPYASVGAGHVNELVKSHDDNIELTKGFNENLFALTPEVGFLANLAPRLKLSMGIRYNVVFGHSNNLSSFIGLKIPMKSE